MIKYQLSIDDKEIAVFLDVDEPEDVATIKYSEDAGIVEEVKEWLESSAGLYGHLIGDRTTAVDLNSAFISNTNNYSWKLLEGQEILNAYELSIPEGAQT